MPLSDASLETVRSLTGAAIEFTVYGPLTPPFPVPQDATEEQDKVVDALNHALCETFPQIEETDRDKLYESFVPPTPEELTVLEAAAPAIGHSGLRARVFEFLWAFQSGKKPDYALAAAEAYLTYAGEADLPKFAASSALTRALKLTGVYVKHPTGKTLFEQAQRQVLARASDTALSVNERCVAIHELVTSSRDDVGVKAADLLTQLQTLDKLQQADRNHTWRVGLAELRQRVAEKMGAAPRQAAREHLAQVREDEGDACRQDNPLRAKQAYMAAERLRTDLSDAAAAQRLRQKGQALGPAIIQSMQPIQVEIGDYVDFCHALAARECGKGTLQDAAALIATLPAVHSNTGAEQSGSLLHRLFGQVHFGGLGQVNNATGQSGESGYPLDEMYWNAQLSAILATRFWIAAAQQWSPSQQDLQALVQASPVVPPTARRLVTLGLAYALDAKMLEAACLLAPQVEEMLRRALRVTGKLAPYTEPTGEQKLTTLGGLLEGANLIELETLFGPDLMRDAKRVLDPESLNVRNNLLHGLNGESYAEQWPGIVMVQLAWRLIFGAHPGLSDLAPSSSLA